MKTSKVIAAVAAFVITTVVVTIALVQSNIVTYVAESTAINSMNKEVELIVQALEDDAAISITEEIGGNIRNTYTATTDMRLIFVDIDKAWRNNPSLTAKFGLDNEQIKAKLANYSLTEEQVKALSEVPGTPSFDYIKNKMVTSYKKNMWTKTETAISEVEQMVTEKFLSVLPKVKELQTRLDRGVAPTVEDAQLVESILSNGLPALLDARFDILHNGKINKDLGLSITELDGTMYDASVVRSATRPDLIKYQFVYDFDKSVESINGIESAKSFAILIYLAIAALFGFIVAKFTAKQISMKMSEQDMIMKSKAMKLEQEQIELVEKREENASKALLNAKQELIDETEELEKIEVLIEENSQKTEKIDLQHQEAEQKVTDAEENLKNNRFSKELAKKEQDLIDNTIPNSEIAAATDFAKDQEELDDINKQMTLISDGSDLVKKVKGVHEHAKHMFAKKLPLKAIIKELDEAHAQIGNFNLASLINKLKALPKTMRKPDAEKNQFANEVVDICIKLEKELNDSTLKLGTLEARKEEIEQSRNTLGASRVAELNKLSNKLNKCYILTGEINELKGRVEDLQAGPEAAKAELKKVQDETATAKAELEEERNALIEERNQVTSKIKVTEIKVEIKQDAVIRAESATDDLVSEINAKKAEQAEETEEESSTLLTKAGDLWKRIPLPNFHKNTISCIAGALVVLVTFF